VLAELNHFPRLDPPSATKIGASDQNADETHRVLPEKGAPRRCFVISSDLDRDATEMDLNPALETVVRSGCGTIISFIPGELAFFEDEEVGERSGLERPA